MYLKFTKKGTFFVSLVFRLLLNELYPFLPSKIVVGIVKSFVWHDGFMERVVVLSFFVLGQQLSAFQRKVYQQWTVRYIHDTYDSHDPWEADGSDHLAARNGT